MVYKAKVKIGGFKVGDIVPDETAEEWNKMYVYSPVELVEGDSPKIEPKAEEKKEEPWLDDYLNRNSFVVKKNLGKDKLSKSRLKSLLKMEKGNKKRRDVIAKIKKELDN